MLSRRSLIAVALAALTGVLATFVLTRPARIQAAALDVVSLAHGTAVHLATPSFIAVGKRYAISWPGGGPAQTFLVKQIRSDGWILVEVAEETIKPELYIPGEFPTRWLHVALATSIQEMRALPY